MGTNLVRVATPIGRQSGLSLALYGAHPAALTARSRVE